MSTKVELGELIRVHNYKTLNKYAWFMILELETVLHNLYNTLYSGRSKLIKIIRFKEPLSGEEGIELLFIYNGKARSIEYYPNEDVVVVRLEDYNKLILRDNAIEIKIVSSFDVYEIVITSDRLLDRAKPIRELVKKKLQDTLRG